MITPTSDTGYWITDNFIIGTHLDHSVYWTGDCCTHTLRLHVTDTRGHVTTCSAGMELVEQAGSSSVMVSAVVVITVVLIIVILSCIVIIIVIRRKRKAQLENMRHLPN